MGEIIKKAQDVITAEDIKKYLCPQATEREVMMALQICRAYGLNPFRREIHIIKYSQKAPATIVVGYEVYIKRAQRTGLLDGWKVELKGEGRDQVAVVTIHRKDWSHPFVWEVSRKEFDRGTPSWKAMPEFMLKKVAIAQGFRLCFPEELGGIPYTPEEVEGMETQSSQSEPEAISELQPESISEASGAPEASESKSDNQTVIQPKAPQSQPQSQHQSQQAQSSQPSLW